MGGEERDKIGEKERKGGQEQCRMSARVEIEGWRGGEASNRYLGVLGFGTLTHNDLSSVVIDGFKLSNF